jgi:hypothetical protein
MKIPCKPGQVALLAVAAAFLAGCVDRTDQSAENSRAAPGDRPSVFDDLTGTIDRAEAVENTVRDSAAETRRRIDEAEGL